jgi:hypothetical protein
LRGAHKNRQSAFQKHYLPEGDENVQMRQHLEIDLLSRSLYFLIQRMDVIETNEEAQLKCLGMSGFVIQLETGILSKWGKY